MKKVDRSGTSSAIVEKARRDLDVYSFFFWLKNYLKPRKTKCNIHESQEEEVEEDTDYEGETEIDIESTQPPNNQSN